MITRCIFSGIICVFLLSGIELRAQDAQTADPERMAAAHELLVAMQTEAAYEESIVNIVDLQTSQNPALEPFGPVLLEFFQKYGSWELLKDRFAEAYAAEFTVEEISQLIDFYETDLGRKVARATPRIQSATTKIGFEIGAKHQAELQRMIMEEMEKQRESDTDPNFPH